jgi:glycosyltransferase involved in cell wall biosynthesis
MNKKVAIIGTVGLPAKYGGFETLAEHLVENKGKEFDFLVYCSKNAYPNGPDKEVKATLKYIPLEANGVQSIVYDIWSILHAIGKVDSLLILGVSGCIILPFVKLFSKKRIIVNIDGLEWKRDKWGNFAKKFLKFSEKWAVKYADIVVADNKVIQQHVKNSYGKDAELIAYGGDHCIPVAISQDTIKEYPYLSSPYAFKVCRIEPENNIEMILKAFAAYEKMSLVIVGNWNVSDYSKKIRSQFENKKNIYLLDPIYDQDKLNQLRSNCLVYVHGHSAGGTNPSLVEAMYLKLPILAYGINYNKETTKTKAFYFSCSDSLRNSLRNFDKVGLNKNALNMYAIALRDYTWGTIANKYAGLFNSN